MLYRLAIKWLIYEVQLDKNNPPTNNNKYRGKQTKHGSLKQVDCTTSINVRFDLSLIFD